MDFKDTKTYQNLKKAYEGELKAGSKYANYAEIADEEGYRPVGRIFKETSENEREHAMVWNRFLNGGKNTSTIENLKDAITGEHYEWTEMYEDFANTADEEGYDDIASMFRKVALIEHHHDVRFKKLLNKIDDNLLFCNDSEVIWVCMNCGFLYYGKCAPEKCPVCGYPQDYFEKMDEEE